jgi:hypothetical protein
LHPTAGASMFLGALCFTSRRRGRASSSIGRLTQSKGCAMLPNRSTALWTLSLVLVLSTRTSAEEPPVIPIGLDAYRQWERWPYQRIGARASTNCRRVWCSPEGVQMGPIPMSSRNSAMRRQAPSSSFDRACEAASCRSRTRSRGLGSLSRTESWGAVRPVPGCFIAIATSCRTRKPATQRGSSGCGFMPGRCPRCSRCCAAASASHLLLPYAGDRCVAHVARRGSKSM